MTTALLLLAEPFDPDSSPQDTIAVYLSDVGYQSPPGDSPANTVFPERLLEAFSYSARLFGGEDAYPRGQGSASYGELVIANGDGAYDYLLEMGWTGRRVRLLRTDKYGGTAAGSEVVFDGTCTAISVRDDDVVLALTSRAEIFNRPLLAAAFAGTGGAEGDSDLEGKRKPLCLGSCINVQAVLLVAAENIFFVGVGPLEGIGAVRMQGVALAPTSDYADYAALVGSSPGSGEYSTCLAEGLIKIGSAVAGDITCDVDGYTTGGSSGYAQTAAEMAQLIVTEFLGDENLSGGDLDAAAFAALDAAQDAPLQYHASLDSQVTVAEALDWILAGVGAWWLVRFDGKLTVGRLDAPTGTATTVINAKDDVLPEVTIRRLIPPWRWQVGWRRIWHVQSADSLASGVTAGNRRLYSTEWSSRPAQDVTIRERELSAEELFLEAGFTVANDAGTEAVRLRNLHAERQLVTLPMAKVDAGKVADPFAAPLGQVVELAGFNRWGWGASKKFILIGVTTDQSGANVTWELWG